MGRATPPAASISFAAVKIVPGNLGFGSAVFAAIAMEAPSAAARRAIAKPIPREPPVTKIRFPFRFPEIDITVLPFLLLQLS